MRFVGEVQHVQLARARTGSARRATVTARLESNADADNFVATISWACLHADQPRTGDKVTVDIDVEAQ